jgi:hypothetical protein
MGQIRVYFSAALPYEDMARVYQTFGLKASRDTGGGQRWSPYLTSEGQVSQFSLEIPHSLIEHCDWHVHLDPDQAQQPQSRSKKAYCTLAVVALSTPDGYEATRAVKSKATGRTKYPVLKKLKGENDGDSGEGATAGKCRFLFFVRADANAFVEEMLKLPHRTNLLQLAALPP